MNATDTSESQATEPFLGDELTSIVIVPGKVELHFQRDVLQIGGRFTLFRQDHADEQFEPEKRRGDIQALWPLIGQSITSTCWGPNWGDTVELMFKEAALIRILPVSTGFRGTILGKFPPPGGLQIQDF